MASLALAALVGPGPFGERARANPSPVTLLGADNLVEAQSSGGALVEIRGKASFSIDPDVGDLNVEGRGRIIAFSLQRAGSAYPSDAIRVIRYNGCFAPGCAPDEPRTSLRVGFGAQYESGTNRAVLKPGAYKLVVLTDGAPVTARLRLQGPKGSVRMSPDVPAQSGFRDVDSTSLSSGSLGSGAAETMAWSGGTRTSLNSANSLLLAFVQQDSPANTGAIAYACQFGDGAKPARGHYLPGCPAEGGDVAFGALGTVLTAPFADLSLPPAPRLRLATELPASRGAQFSGFSISRTSPAANPRGYIAFLRLD